MACRFLRRDGIVLRPMGSYSDRKGTLSLPWIMTLPERSSAEDLGSGVVGVLEHAGPTGLSYAEAEAQQDPKDAALIEEIRLESRVGQVARAGVADDGARWTVTAYEHVGEGLVYLRPAKRTVVVYEEGWARLGEVLREALTPKR